MSGSGASTPDTGRTTERQDVSSFAEARDGASHLQANTERPNGRKQKHGDGAWQLPDRRLTGREIVASALVLRKLGAEAVAGGDRDAETAEPSS
jgi:hypothetical protein